MPTTKKYEVENVAVVKPKERRSTWKWEGHTIRGREITYKVIDHNFGRLRQWSFTVKVPAKLGQIVIQPQDVPGKKVFAELEHRSIVFVKATKSSHRGKLYCKVFLSDPTGEKNRVGVAREQRRSLPPWFSELLTRIRVKSTVMTKVGRDREALVALVESTDYEAMIQLYFAMRVWVLQEGFILAKAGQEE